MFQNYQTFIFYFWKKNNPQVELRKRSKAHEAGLMEGDALLGINGYSCQNITHGTAMGLIESSPNLNLIILRRRLVIYSHSYRSRYALPLRLRYIKIVRHDGASSVAKSKRTTAHLVLNTYPSDRQTTADFYIQKTTLFDTCWCPILKTNLIPYQQQVVIPTICIHLLENDRSFADLVTRPATEFLHPRSIPGLAMPERGATSRDAVNAAIQALGTELQPVTAAIKTSAQTTKSVRRSPAPSPTITQTGGAHTQHQVVNGYGAPERYRRQEQTYADAEKTTHVITETSKEQFGDTTITKVKRETVTQYGQKPMFNVSNVATGIPASAVQKPGIWTPPGGASKMTVSAPSGVHVQHNPDQSITMTIGLHGARDESKENIAPQHQQQTANMPPMFKVSKFNNKPEEQPKPGSWNPSAGPVTKAPEPAPRHQTDESTAFGDDNIPLLPEEEAELKAHLESLKKPLPNLLQKVLVDGSGSDREGTPDSPGYLTRRRIEQFASDYDYETEEELHKRKMFADSAFYDDPEHKYPTIEEQVKMARKVAMSLLAPANKKARGHRMFMRRMVKSQKWTTDQDRTEKDFEWENDEEEEKYYNPNPWSGITATWQPPKQADLGPKKVPPPPPVPTNLLQAPGYAMGTAKKEEKAKALSADEFERMRLFEAKTDHTQVSPALCFSLAEDLRNMKGKGGKLFAKRVARAEKWVVDENPTPSKPNPELIQKIAMQAAAGGAMPMPMPGLGPAPNKAPAQKRDDGGPVVNRLKEMIDPPKPKMTPWEAAARNDGDVQKAFDHLRGYNPYGRSMTGELASNLDGAAQKNSYTAPPNVVPAAGSSTAGEQSSKLPDYMRKIKPWNLQDHGSASAAGIHHQQLTSYI
ncbi:hypothetical protein LSH36_349g01000 [Paralvinella palmiformis]|uniref:PDZ domain-containing protein n=1 Tax=Paralvinella palmiformis TaxID=53620 RepID=A0AAD9JF79_9ANNE|nr:hypothetical protein LSH36_349g01000 [Paralvinella palmiformis]